MNISKQQQAIEKAGYCYSELRLSPGTERKQWLCPRTATPMSVEKAVLSHFEGEGWKGFAGEGGLVLNLIKAMSFKELPESHRLAYVESAYYCHSRQTDDRLLGIDLLGNLREATVEQVSRNFQLMLRRQRVVHEASNSDYLESSILDFFPGLEEWMILELMEVAGHDLLYNIASLFAQDPYGYRRGWPDITMWRSNELRFVEVKAPGDRLHESQKRIAAEIAAPLSLDFRLVSVLSR